MFHEPNCKSLLSIALSLTASSQKQGQPGCDLKVLLHGRGYTWQIINRGQTMMVRIIFLIVMCAGVAAFAHQDEPVAEAVGFDCEHPPEGAVKSLPGLLGEAGRLVCMQSGQRIVASQAWSWRYSGSFLNTPMFLPMRISPHAACSRRFISGKSRQRN